MVGELVINGIDKLVGTTILGKRIKSLKVSERFGRDSMAYAFTMAGNPNQPAPRDFDSEFEVVLGKFPKNGAYELFCLGNLLNTTSNSESKSLFGAISFSKPAIVKA